MTATKRRSIPMYSSGRGTLLIGFQTSRTSVVRLDPFITWHNGVVSRPLLRSTPKDRVDGTQQAKVLDRDENDRARNDSERHGIVRQASEQKCVPDYEHGNCRQHPRASDQASMCLHAWVISDQDVITIVEPQRARTAGLGFRPHHSRRCSNRRRSPAKRDREGRCDHADESAIANRVDSQHLRSRLRVAAHRASTLDAFLERPRAAPHAASDEALP